MENMNQEKNNPNIYQHSDGTTYHVVTDEAKEIFTLGLFPLYELLPDSDAESLIETFEQLHQALENGSLIGIELGKINN